MSYCLKDPSDEQILRIYARENNTQRGEDNSAQAGPIASAVKVLARQLRRSEKAQAKARRVSTPTSEQKDSIGRNSIAKLCGYEAHSEIVRLQVANLKASGDYARILSEVEAEFGDDAPEKLKDEAAKARARHPRIFDTQGVQKILKTPEQVKTFREIVTSKAIKDALPVERQADLARKLVEKAAANEKPDGTPAPKEVSGRFLRDETVGLMLQTKAIARKMDDDERAELERGDWEKRAANLMDDMARAGRSMMTNMQALIKHAEKRPRGVVLQRTVAYADLIDNLSRIIKLDGRLK